MMESLRNFRILLHKCWLVSKRHWVKTLLGQVLLPVGLIVCAWFIFEKKIISEKTTSTDSHHEMESSESLIDLAINNQYIGGVPLMYALNNTFVDGLMMKVHECFKNKTIMKKFSTEADLIQFIRGANLPFENIAIIFDRFTDNSTKYLKYTLCLLSKLNNELYYPSYSPRYYYVRVRPIVPIQICVSKSFIRMISENAANKIPKTFIQEAPYPARIESPKTESRYPVACHFLLMLAFAIPASVETLKAINEKIVGINVLMSMNGISTTLNLLTWSISGLFWSSITGILSTFLMLYSSDKSRLPFAMNGDPSVLLLIIILHITHTITFNLHVSMYVSKALMLLPVISLVNILAIVLQIYVLEESNQSVSCYMGVIFPIILLYQTINQIYSYELDGYLQWSNMFGNEILMIEMDNSVGMILIWSMIGLIFHFLLAIYVHAIIPGKYGVGKNLLFFLKLFQFQNEQKNDENVQNLVKNYAANKYFESTSAENYSPGIQIRNLKKTYTINLFSKQKVHALRGVSADFYKGQITVLLGQNGAGKSTLMSVLTRMTSATDGLILINAKNLKNDSSEILKGVGLCAQEDMHFPNLTVTEQLELFAMVKRSSKSTSTIKENIKDLIENLKLSSVKNALPKNMSKDQKRKLSLAIALIGDPSTLILDEPTCGLDPHSKRVVWHVLLNIKKQKTILMSTHDMDEADILGDRIAILHDGQLKSYGTPLFLKKMIGEQNNIQVTLSIEQCTDVNRILTVLELERADVNVESGEVVLSVPTSTLPHWLRTLEDNKKDLDISGYSLAHVSLEKVFLKLTKENASFQKSHIAVTNDQAKLKGLALQFQFARALLSNKMSYTLKDPTTVLIQILMVVLTLSTVTFVRMMPEYKDQSEVSMDLNLYDSPRALYAVFNTTFGNRYHSVIRSQGGNPVNIKNETLYNELTRWAKSDLAGYVKHMITAAEFNGTMKSTRANAFYSRKSTYSLPISINLLWNAIIQNILGPDYSISLSSQQVPDNPTIIDLTWFLLLIAPATTVFMILFSFVIALFVIHPSRERHQGMKQLQKMTGVSGFTYWGTMILFDLMTYAFIVLLFIVGSVCLDFYYKLHFYQIEEILVTVLLLMLLAINVLPLVYSFSFIKMKTRNLVKMLTFIPIGFVLCTVVNFFHVYINVLEFPEGVVNISMLLPHVSFTHALIVFYWIVLSDLRCKRLSNIYYESHCKDGNEFKICCQRKCYNGWCEIPMPFFDKTRSNLEMYVTYLCATPVLYFSILAILECRLFPKLMAKCKFKRQPSAELGGDDQVQLEKSIIFQQIQTFSDKRKFKINIEQEQHTDHASTSSSNRSLILHELKKSYKKGQAVVDVSFGVDRGECFGLFGVNGAGKSTTLKMITGEEIPDHGIIAYYGDEHFRNHGNYFGSQMGYCPQHDVTYNCLNTRDHLRLFARLRGIPENRVGNEVQAWIDRLNLNAWASQPSSTLSSGNNQRLNIAIALAGNPKLVLLDEPTTRMDPAARRSFWKTVKSCQRNGQTFLLASNNSLTYKHGRVLTCIGIPKELQKRFGAGYDVQIRINPRKASTQLDQVKKDMRSMLQCLLTNENSTCLMYNVSGPGTTWKKVYEVMDKIKSKYDCIDDFLVIVRLST